MRAVICALAVFIATPSLTSATPITYEFTGIVTSTSSYYESLAPELAALFPIGSIVTYTLTYDESAGEYNTSSGGYLYRSTVPQDQFWFDATISGHEYFRSDEGGVWLTQSNDRLFIDTILTYTHAYNTRIAAVDGDVVGVTDPWYASYLNVYLPIVWPDFSLPSSFPADQSGTFILGLLSESQLGNDCTRCGSTAQIRGTFTAARQVPEPAGSVLVALGLGLALLWKRGLPTIRN